MIAIISDLHANEAALRAVMEHAAAQNVTEILCLGDIVGYGPDPEACVDLVSEKCRFALSGNHDYAVLSEAYHFNPIAAVAVACHRERMKPRYADMQKKVSRWQYLENAPLRQLEGDVLYVHASPRDERNEYILESDTGYGYGTPKLDEIFSLISRLCFVGHTHFPGIFTELYEFLKPTDDNCEFELKPGYKYVINTGSVGQPRDGDPRACYVTVGENVVRYHRVKYDIAQTMERIKRNACLHAYCAERLQLGR
ncbi:MAG TPA: metallophosphoesterase family protein [Candidatus Brocadiia bacterium]|nr:metallophosphoesterase family protein [Candidatus Brocadiia bacterium]